MEEEKTLNELREIAGAAFAYLRNWKTNSGKKVLGYFCTNTPEEMIQAAGLLPVRILTSKESLSLASRHLQSYSCSLVQSSLESALRGDLDFLDGTVFPHTCDSIQRLSDIWAANLHLPFHWDIVLPVKMYTESARAYLIQELRRFRSGLEGFIGRPITDEDLRAAIALFNENRALLKRIYLHRQRHPDQISAADFFSLIKTATFMPKEEHSASLRRITSGIENLSPQPPKGVRLFLAGSVCDHAQVYDLMDSSGAWIVGDDLCTGWRQFSEDVSPNGDPIEALADRLFRKVPCPCKHNPEKDRGEDLLRRVIDSGAQGVVFILLKFCDPHAFDFPYLKEILEKQKIPTLLLELDPGGIARGALETRIRAFVERLEF